jgi:hypothetical protein
MSFSADLILIAQICQKEDSSMISDSLIERALSESRHRKVADVRAGLGYSCVMLEDGACGLAYTFRNELGDCCSILGSAGSLIGKDVDALIPWLRDGNLLKAAVGLAAVNAVINEAGKRWDTGNVIDAITIGPSDTFGMIGNFKPIMAKVRTMTEKIYVFERNVPEGSGLYPSETIPVHLPKCDVVILTATSLINHTFDEVVESCKNAREVCMVGPSTPLCGEIFKPLNITLLAGSVVTNPGLILQIVSQGGGTLAMKPAVRQVLLRV